MHQATAHSNNNNGTPYNSQLIQLFVIYTHKELYRKLHKSGIFLRDQEIKCQFVGNFQTPKHDHATQFSNQHSKAIKLHSLSPERTTINAICCIQTKL